MPAMSILCKDFQQHTILAVSGLVGCLPNLAAVDGLSMCLGTLYSTFLLEHISHPAFA